MRDAYIPVVFQRHARRPYRLPQRMDPEQKRRVTLEHASGFREELEAISESGAFKALYHFWHSEHRNLAQWFSDEVLPTLYTTSRQPDTSPPPRLHNLSKPTHRRGEVAEGAVDSETGFAEVHGR